MSEPIVIGDATLHLGDCLDVLKTLPDCSVDSVVTDPPAGISFMGKNWDKDKGGRAQWVAWMTEIAAECLRVLKPGGHALVWAIPRTSHWTATALEDAGFEVRDRIVHCFGSGFPKSADVSKMLDKAAGVEREVVGQYQRPDGQPRNVADWNDSSRNTYSPADQIALKQRSAPATDAAKRWQGFGTTLKPAIEDWWLLRKPFKGTVAANVLKHGCGALNIDGCRVATTGESQPRVNERSQGNRYTDNGSVNLAALPGVRGGSPQGRFPAHLVLDGSEEVVALFPVTKSGTLNQGAITAENCIYGKRGGYTKQNTKQTLYESNEGSAARFFYCAKASRSDRGEGNTHPCVKPQTLMRYLCRLITPPGGVILDPFTGSGSTGKAAILEGFRFVGIEREAEYLDIAQARIRAAIPHPSQSTLALEPA